MKLGKPDKLAAVCPRCGLFAATREEQLRKCGPCRRSNGLHALGGRAAKRAGRGIVGS